MFGQHGQQSPPQSAGSGTTPSGSAADQGQGKSKWPHQQGGGGQGQGQSQWPTTWPPTPWWHGQQQQTPPPPAPAPAPAPGLPAWTANWEAQQAQQLAGLPQWARGREQHRDDRQRQWYQQNSSQSWFAPIEAYLARKYGSPQTAPGTPPPQGGGNGGGGNGGGGGGAPPPMGSGAAFTPGTFDRDPRPFT